MLSPFHVTYEVVTEESTKHNDAVERGFVLPDGWKQPLPEFVHGIAAAKIKGACGMRLRQAVALIGCVQDCWQWFFECEASQDLRTGDSETLALHPPDNITRASYARLRRLLKAR